MAPAKRGTGSAIVSETIFEVISRADELGELVALYWKLNPAPEGKKHAPLSAQMKKGLARAFKKFDEYQLKRYGRRNGEAVAMRDVMFLTHPAPDEDRKALWDGLANKTLAPPDTWESALVGGADKKETFTRLLTEGSSAISPCCGISAARQKPESIRR